MSRHPRVGISPVDSENEGLGGLHFSQVEPPTSPPPDSGTLGKDPFLWRHLPLLPTPDARPSQQNAPYHQSCWMLLESVPDIFQSVGRAIYLKFSNPQKHRHGE